MPQYQICDTGLRTNCQFPELRPAHVRESSMKFILESAVTSHQQSFRWFHRWPLRDGSTWLLIGRSDSGFVLRFPNLADFFVSATTKKIRCQPIADIATETIRHLFLDQVIPLVLSQQGRIVLHGAASRTPYGVAAFVGESGAGKSTLAASFALEGCPVLTDDCLLLDRNQNKMIAMTSYSGVRLWPHVALALYGAYQCGSTVAHYTTKRRFSCAKLPTNGQPISGIFFMDARDDESNCAISAEEVPTSQALLNLIRYSFILDVTSSSFLRTRFEELGNLALMTVSYKLSFPRGLALLPTLRDLVLRKLASAHKQGRRQHGSLSRA